MNFRRACYPFVFYLAFVRIVWAAPAPGTLLDKIVAHVDDQVILQSELETAYQQYLLQGGKEEPGLQCKILKSLITNQLLLTKANQEGIIVEKATLEQALQDRMQYLLEQTGSEDALVQYWGKPTEAIKSELKVKIKEQLTLDRMNAQLLQDISVTPREVKEFFEALPAQERPYYSAEVAVRQILRYPQMSQKEKDTLFARLKDLKTRLQNGEDFGALARANSQDTGSAVQGGTLGFRRLGDLAPAYEEAALALKPGEVSDPIVTLFGVHLIQLIAQEKDSYNSRHILLKPTMDIEVAKEQLVQIRTAILAGEVTFKQAAKQYSEDPSSASSGGLLTEEDGGTRMSVDALPSDIYFAIDQLMPNEISEPMLYTTADGRAAVRIILLEDKVAPHHANLVQDYTKIRQLLLDKKRIAFLQQWLEHTKARTFINIAPEYQHCERLKY
mmetsp:Transcript_3879/g.8746  ORF Transcript_3879/g.8746 Transcript_3879/m.8746 type:complete len:444 (+) Transcript_3879:6754-8085(+)